MEEPQVTKPTEVKCDFDEEEHERRYPKHKQQCKEGKLCRPADGLMLKVGQSINDIPVEQRHRYMWIVPDELKDHPMYKEKDWGARMIRDCEEKKCCEENEKKKKQKDKDDKIDQQDRTIQALVDHVAKLTDAVNKLSKGGK
jgi:hypothetical protein